MEKTIEEKLRENQEQEKQLSDLLRKLDEHENDAVDDYKSDMKSLDDLQEAWKGSMAQHFMLEADQQRTGVYQQMRALIDRQRDEARSALERNRQEREALLAEKRREENG